MNDDEKQIFNDLVQAGIAREVDLMEEIKELRKDFERLNKLIVHSTTGQDYEDIKDWLLERLRFKTDPSGKLYNTPREAIDAS